MKKTILILLAALSFQAQASRQEDPTGLTQITEDSRLDSSACLRMLSSTTCGAYGDLSDAVLSGKGNCSLQMAFRLSSNENVVHKISGIGSYSNDVFDGPLVVVGIVAEALTLGLSDKAMESGAKHAAYNKAEKNLQITIAKVAEALELKGVAKCSDFKNNSSTVHKPSESGSAD